jgi:hypothetical protein
MNELIEATENRHPSTANIAKWLEPNPNLTGNAAIIASAFENLALSMVDAIEQDSPELTAGLRKLLEAKDCFVRATLDEQPGFWTDR